MGLGREEPYFDKEHSDSKSKYTDDVIINMLEFLVDNIIVVLGERFSNGWLAFQWAQIVPLSWPTYFCTHTKRNSYSLYSRLERNSKHPRSTPYIDTSISQSIIQNLIVIWVRSMYPTELDDGEKHLCFLLGFTPVDREGRSAANFP